MIDDWMGYHFLLHFFLMMMMLLDDELYSSLFFLGGISLGHMT
jgi:hypothetical protein